MVRKLRLCTDVEEFRRPDVVRIGAAASTAAASETLLVSTRQEIQALGRRLSALPWLVMIPVLAFFLLKDAGSIRRIIIVGAPISSSYAVLLGFMAGALEFIPMVGPFLLATIATIAATVHAPVTALWTIDFLAMVRAVEDYVVYPRLMRRSLELHPLAVIVGVMAGAELDGVVGMFLGVPTVATATVICRHSLQWQTSVASVRRRA